MSKRERFEHPAPECRDKTWDKQTIANCCWTCGVSGHKARDCLLGKPSGTEKQERYNDDRRANAMKLVEANTVIELTSDEQAVYLEMKHRCDPWMCLLDSGAQRSLVPGKLMYGIHLELCSEKLFACNMTQINLLGEATIRIIPQLVYKSDSYQN